MKPHRASDVIVIPDDPSPCSYCGRPKATARTPIHLKEWQEACWRKPSMRGSHSCVLDCKEFQNIHGPIV